ncbi:uncharacterized protein LOC126675059 [Mercurialis annua]|uniref:uncharacterized protein LOC126675059 n=1 Tax=Mercurialis annua TaxID=3986 RepID=UPI0024AF431B|nr:uncharacterized protein LOC126675059 [Mercurialis annua]
MMPIYTPYRTIVEVVVNGSTQYQLKNRKSNFCRKRILKEGIKFFCRSYKIYENKEDDTQIALRGKQSRRKLLLHLTNNSMDKKWMNLDNKADPLYVEGVNNFLQFAFSQPGISNSIRCPCNGCRNVVFKNMDEVRLDLFQNGINRSYNIWNLHGESLINLEKAENNYDENYDDFLGMLRDACGVADMNVDFNGETDSFSFKENYSSPIPNNDAAKFFRLLGDAQKNLYPDCKNFNKLSFIVNLLHIKCLCQWSDRSVDMLLSFLKKTYPEGENLPSSYYEAKKVITDLGLDYVKIDVCCNDCILYWGENAESQECPTCHSSRWKSSSNISSYGQKIPHKVLRYFPLKSRLQRLYMSKKTATNMTWHKNGRTQDGKLRHPADAIAWKSFDEKHSAFAADPRNVRLGLACDGFQPFGNMTSQHSLWPVVLVPYNLPPWMCMKAEYSMLSLLIPGPKSPGMDIDVFLQPLIDELKQLWEEGIETYDAHNEENFNLRASILWTISDFPAYAYLSGWSTKGHMACPCCHKETASCYLKGARKVCYMGHRRFLPRTHKWRQRSELFDGTKEKRKAPIPLSGEEVLHEFSLFEQCPFGKSKKKKYDASNSVYNWRKKSIFYQLPYWETLLLRHNLDVMHIEKNICDNILGTLMKHKDKNKDTENSRYDLLKMGIRPELHPRTDGATVHFPTACYTLSSKEKSVLSKKVYEPLVELSVFFKDLCSKTLDLESINKLQVQIINILCKLEMIFPPAFFDVMVHLAVHLPMEAKLGGPVQYRWMYPIERYLRTLKSYVRNMARPEGSIAAGYLANECLTFCSRYLVGVDTKHNRVPRNYDGDYSPSEEVGLEIFKEAGRALGKANHHRLTLSEAAQCHSYVLYNCDEVLPFIEQHKSELAVVSNNNIMGRHKKEFNNWWNVYIRQDLWMMTLFA